MSGDSKPGEFRNPSDQRLEALLSGMKRVAVVGISPKEDRASHGIAKFLVNLGIEVVGVNPMQSEPILGCPVYASLEDVPGPVDIVDIFRRSEAVPPHRGGCDRTQGRLRLDAGGCRARRGRRPGPAVRPGRGHGPLPVQGMAQTVEPLTRRTLR